MEKSLRAKNHPFGFTVEALVYPILLLVILWLVQWSQQIFHEIRFASFGVLPRSLGGLQGILFSPVIHAKNDLAHIVNNSMAIGLLLSVLIFYYRQIAFKVFSGIYFCSGVFLWSFAQNDGSYHIGISGIVYGLVAFLFFSGVFRKYFPLQAISLFIVFLYGSSVWGIFPIKEGVSWEGHLAGLVAGIIFAYTFRKKGVQRPKFQYEIEKEMGIEPPDLEAIWNENQRRIKEEKERQEREAQGYFIVYDYKPTSKPERDSEPQ